MHFTVDFSRRGQKEVSEGGDAIKWPKRGWESKPSFSLVFVHRADDPRDADEAVRRRDNYDFGGFRYVFWSFLA